MISYGGVELVVLSPDRDAKIVLAIQDFIDELKDLDMPVWTGIGPQWQIPDYGPQHRTKLGRLYWPRSASKFAVGRFLATENQLDRIRSQSYTDGSSGQQTLPLIIDDGTARITTDLYMLPPRPCYQWDGPPAMQDGEPNVSKNLYLLTLVDQRYWWWRKAAQITIDQGQSWETTFTQLSDALSLTDAIAVDDIESVYLVPSKELAGNGQFLPPLLDAVSSSVGQRIGVKLDGTVYSQSLNGAIAVIENLRDNVTIASGSSVHLLDRYQIGGQFRFDYTSEHQDLVPLVPDTVKLYFPMGQITDSKDPTDPCAADRDCKDLYSVEVPLAELQSDAFPWYNDIMVKRGVKVFHTTAFAWYFGTTLQNSAELENLAQQLARDWYGWQAWGYLHQIIPSVIPWDGDAAHDYVEWEAFPTLRTRIVRENFHDLAQWVFQQSTRPANSSSSGEPGGGSSGAPNTGSWFTYQMRCEAGYLNRYRQLVTIDWTQNRTTTGDWVLDAQEGCCGCAGFSGSSGPGSSGSPNPDDCVSGTTDGIAWSMHRQLRLQFLLLNEIIVEKTVVYTSDGVWALDETFLPCIGDLPNLEMTRYQAAIVVDPMNASNLVIKLTVWFDDISQDYEINFSSYIPIPPPNQQFLEDAPVTEAAFSGPGPFLWCGSRNLEGYEVYSLRLIGESCQYPPPTDDCVPGIVNDIPFLLPAQMMMRLFRRPLGADPAVLMFQMPLQNQLPNGNRNLWQFLDQPVHPCDGTQPNLRTTGSAVVAPAGNQLNLQMSLSDGATPVTTFTADVPMPSTYGGEIYDTEPATPLTLPANAVCSNDASDEFDLQLVAVPCNTQPPPGVVPQNCADLGDTTLPVTFRWRKGSTTGVIVAEATSTLYFSNLGCVQLGAVSPCWGLHIPLPPEVAVPMCPANWGGPPGLFDGISSFAIGCSSTPSGYTAGYGVQGEFNPSWFPSQTDLFWVDGFLMLLGEPIGMGFCSNLADPFFMDVIIG